MAPPCLPQAIQWLLKTETQPATKATALCHAARAGHLDIVECLLDAGAGAVEDTSEDGDAAARAEDAVLGSVNRAMEAAAAGGHHGVVERLLKAGASEAGADTALVAAAKWLLDVVGAESGAEVSAAVEAAVRTLNLLLTQASERGQTHVLGEANALGQQPLAVAAAAGCTAADLVPIITAGGRA